MKLAILGADSFHVPAFISWIHKHTMHRVVAVYADRTSTKTISTNRMPDILAQVHQLAVPVMDQLVQLPQVDGYFILTVDASLHLQLFRQLIAKQRPIFIDKPCTYERSETVAILKEARQSRIPVQSASALRFSSCVTQALVDRCEIKRLIVQGPLYMEPEIPPYHWYGIHLLEMVQAIGKDMLVIQEVVQEESREVVSGTVGSLPFQIIGDRCGNQPFQITTCFENDQKTFVLDQQQPLYEPLLQRLMTFFETGKGMVSDADIYTVIHATHQIHQRREYNAQHQKK